MCGEGDVVSRVGGASPTHRSVVGENGCEGRDRRVLVGVGVGAVRPDRFQNHGDLLCGEFDAGAAVDQGREVCNRHVGVPIAADCGVASGHAADFGKEFVGVPVGVALPEESRVGVPVVGGDDEKGVGMPGLESQCHSDGVVECDLIPDQSGCVVDMGSVVDFGPFHLEYEVIGGGFEAAQRGRGHLRQCRDAGEQCRVIYMVHRVGHVGLRERAKQRLVPFLIQELIA